MDAPYEADTHTDFIWDVSLVWGVTESNKRACSLMIFLGMRSGECLRSPSQLEKGMMLLELV